MPNPQTPHQLRIHLIITHPEVIKLDLPARKKFLETNFLPALHKVNELYNPTANPALFNANIRFIFDPVKDVEYDSEAETFSGKALQEKAALYRGKILMFYRGNGSNAGSP